ncbi:flagellar hook-basal body protein [Microbulbifer sp. TYP-18]|uniref:flagellar hook-basal body protein n=1 Tax=Microbulbifer sp. TYP-18 TaxID=3230024 RepID=UPI0034C61190
MIDGIDIVAGSMQADINRLNVASQNLANMDTNAYKRVTDEVTVPKNSAQNITSVESGSGQIDYSQGVLKYTGRKLNLAIEGDGFFQVKNGDSLFLTRRGELKVDNQGFLTLLNGARLQNENGDVQLASGDFKVDRQGNIYQDGNLPLSKLSIVHASPEQLVSVGTGLYTGRLSQPVEIPSVRQGFLETSNVNHLQEMVKLVELTRHFEASQLVVQGYNTMLEEAITKIGRL